MVDERTHIYDGLLAMTERELYDLAWFVSEELVQRETVRLQRVAGLSLRDRMAAHFPDWSLLPLTSAKIW